jgi:hypothetical protein
VLEQQQAVGHEVLLPRVLELALQLEAVGVFDAAQLVDVESAHAR